MIDNPIYNGDYIAQAKAEINQFNVFLDSIQIQKDEGKQYERENRLPMDLDSFISYSFHHFQKYADEKLSSANPKIYLTDLDDIYIVLKKCISKYCQIIEKSISDTEKIFGKISSFNYQNLDLSGLIYIKQAKFSFQIKKYYETKRKLIDNQYDNLLNSKEADYFENKTVVREVLGQDFDKFSDENVDILIKHILSFTSGEKPSKELPDMHIIGVSQRRLIHICVRIIKKLNWDSKGRSHLANVFGNLIKEYKDFKPVRFNKDTIRKGMY